MYEIECVKIKNIHINHSINIINIFTMNKSINIPEKVWDKIGVNLHNVPNHPLNIIKEKIYCIFEGFETYDNISPIVSTEDNFDKLLIPKGHPSRSLSDTYYIDDKTVLRSQTSAHQNNLIPKHDRFMVVGDVYRRDEVDRTHNYVFHQVEGVKLMKGVNEEEVINDLKLSLSDLIKELFGECEWRFAPDYFPFTSPSFEVEVMYNEKWIEVLGCGVIERKILDSCGREDYTGWAFGLGLERLAMILFDIDDIRLFWSNDQKFLSQFKNGRINKFKKFSKLDEIEQCITLILPTCDVEEGVWLKEMQFYELCCNMPRFMDMIQEVKLVDVYVKKSAYTFKIVYSPPDARLTCPKEFKVMTLRHLEWLRKNAVHTLDVTMG